MSQAEWIEGFVVGLADPSIPDDEAYLRLIGEKLYSALSRLTPEVVVESLLAQRLADGTRFEVAAR